MLIFIMTIQANVLAHPSPQSTAEEDIIDVQVIGMQKRLTLILNSGWKLKQSTSDFEKSGDRQNQKSFVFPIYFRKYDYV